MIDRNDLYNDLDQETRADLDFMQDKFSADDLHAPDGLSEDAIRNKLALAAGEADHTASTSSSTKTRPSNKPRPWLRPLIGFAACAALALCFLPAILAVLPDSDGSSSDAPAMTAQTNGLHQFTSYDELDQTMKELLPEDRGDDMFVLNDLASSEMTEGIEMDSSDMEGSSASDSGKGSSPAPGSSEAQGSSEVQDSSETAASSDSLTASGNDSASNADDPAHSSTYTQVEDIDEADIVKTDGKYIYYLSNVENQVVIVRAKDGKVKRVAAVGGSTDSTYIHNLYVTGDQLIIIGSDSLNDDSEAIAVTMYDISDRANPKQTGRYTQTGYLLSSRLIGSSLCLVTCDYKYSYEKNRIIPFIAYDGKKAQKLPIADISCFPDTATAAFTVIGMVDLTSGKASKDTVKTKAVLGGSDEIYCNGEHLYVTSTVYKNKKSQEQNLTTLYDPGHQQTQVLRVSLADGKVTSQASAFVDGTVNNQFSMDERDGYFRIATTSQVSDQDPATGEDGFTIVDVNNLYILDENMKLTGSLTGFARDEHIEAVRYIDTKAYVITYEETDPLFIIDLKDPAHPTIEGHVKISGFSTLLVPVDQNYLLGLGFSTEDIGMGEATDGLKLALFDISDPLNPQVADSQAFTNRNSPVQYDHRALLVGPAAKWYAVPYEDYHWNDDIIVSEDEDGASTDEDGASAASEGSEFEYYTGVLVFSAKAGKIEVEHDFLTDEPVRRCIWIGNWLYAICDDDTIKSFELD